VWNKAWQDKKPNYVYRYGMFDSGQAKALVDFATKKLKKTKLGSSSRTPAGAKAGGWRWRRR